MRRFSLLALCFILAGAGASVWSQTLTALPATAVFPEFSADALTHQLSLSRVTDTREWIGAIGLAGPLLQWGEDLQLGAGATVFNRIIKTPGHITVATVDYRVDFPVDLRLDSLRLRAAFGHVSCHYADDGIEQLGRRSISSVRDYLQFAAAWMVPNGHAYAAGTFNYHNEPVADRRWHLQAGGEMIAFRFGSGVQLYGALDIKIKEDVRWGGTQSYQLGVRLFGSDGRNVRAAYTHRRGFEERGQLYDRQTIMNLFGVYIDLL